MGIDRRTVALYAGLGAIFGVLACIPIALLEPGWVGFYAIGLVAVAVSVWIAGSLDDLDKPDEQLKPAGIRSRDRWRRFVARF